MYKVNCGAYTAQSVSANTDITANLIPENAYGFKIIGFEINCSAAAEIALNDTDSVICAPASSGYSATVNMVGEFFVDIEKIEIVDACDINGLTYYYTVQGFDEVLYAPVVTPVAGDYPAPLTVNITSFNEGAEIYYSVGGGDPETLYEAPIELGATALASGVTIKAKATKAGHYIDSDVATAEFTQAKCEKAVASPAAGTVDYGTKVTLTCSTPDALIRWRFGNTGDRVPYTEPIELTETATLQAIASATGYATQTSASFNYTVTPAPLGVSNTKTGDNWIIALSGGTGANAYFKVGETVELPDAGTASADLTGWGAATLAGGSFVVSSAIGTSGYEIAVVELVDGKVVYGGKSTLA